MTYTTNRRRFLAGSAAAAGAAAFPMPSIAQNAPLKIGLLTVKTGPLAAGGIHFEEGITAFLKDKNFTVSDRKVELIVADTGGNPAGAKTKAQEVVERDKVDIVLGPFAAFELLATVDYLAQSKMPTLAFAGAEDVTQRKANAYLTRTSYTSAQTLYPLADYVYNEMKLKRAATLGDDFAFGYEQVGGFQRVLEDHGGRIELHDAADIRPGQRGAWMRLRFAVSGHAAKAEAKEQATSETKPPATETTEPAHATNDQAKIEAATGN